MTDGQALLLSHLDRPKPIGPNKWEAFSPLREENSASVSITFDGDNILIFDHGEPDADPRDILKAIGLDWPRILPPRKSEPHGQWTHYDYKDADGKVIFQSVRIPCPPPKHKTFRQRRPDGKGGYIWNLKSTRLVLYCLPELLAADPAVTVYVCEGEKDVDRLRSMGLVATTNPMGAGKWSKVANVAAKALRGRCVVVLVDNDDAGRKHAMEVAQSLHGVAASVKVLELPGLPIKGDVSDWLGVGHTIDELRALVAAAPEQATIIEAPSPAEAVTADAVLSPDQHGHRPARAFALTETGGAELLADRLAGDWRYCQDRNQWVRWTGQLWVFDAGDVAITERSKLVAHEFLAEAQWALKADDARAKAFAQFAATAQRRQFRRAIIDLAKSEPGILIPFSEFDADGYLLNCQNGTLDLRKGRLRPQSREDRLTRILPWSYDPDAACPRWEGFLVEILPDAETVEFVRRAIGYTLTADVSEHVLFSCFGAGANGKSVLLNTLLHVFGPYATTAPTSMLVAKQHESHPAEKMVLVGKRLVVFQEIPSGQRLNEALTKALVSGDPDQARAMRENFTTIHPVGKLWLAGNHRLDIREQTEAIWRRYREIPFERVFSEEQRDPRLETKLRDESPGILAWCVRACLDWQRAGLSKSGKVQAATADLRSEMDRLAPFLEECCIVAPSATVPRATLYQTYRAWVERQGSHAVSDKGFAELLRGRGFTPAYGRVNGKTARVWQGLGLVDGTPPLPHLPHIPGKSPYCGPNQSLREGYRGETSESVASVAPDAPDPLAQLGHCLRARPGTAANEQDKTALVSYFAGLNGTSEAAGQRLWEFWRSDPAPTVAAFLERERRAAQRGAR
ncbi:MAG: toprim domain-containing protein [Deltaproteobacteria bacterium]|nr:toprim domain-containing protein [Deltaproteobacteria bacterium]